MDNEARLPRRRHSLRLDGYDYTLAGAYFVTICTANRDCHLGTISAEDFSLSVAGEIVSETWHSLPERFSFVSLDAFVVMPNHLHAVLLLTDLHGPGSENVPANLGWLIRTFKAASTRLIRQAGVSDFAWQRDYYGDLLQVRQEVLAIRNRDDQSFARLLRRVRLFVAAHALRIPHGP